MVKTLYSLGLLNLQEIKMPHRSNPVIAKKGPYVVELEADKSYYWCSCGRSENQPSGEGGNSPCSLGLDWKNGIR